MDDRSKRRLNFTVIDISQFINLRLHGGFIIRSIELTGEPILDAVGREALAQTSAIAREFRLLIRSGLNEEELSVTLYHEILEAASVALANPPARVIDFNEADFEGAARAAQERWGNASPAHLISNLLSDEPNFGRHSDANLGQCRSADGSSACCLASLGTRGRAVRAPTQQSSKGAFRFILNAH